MNLAARPPQKVSVVVDDLLHEALHLRLVELFTHVLHGHLAAALAVLLALAHLVREGSTDLSRLLRLRVAPLQPRCGAALAPMAAPMTTTRR